MTIGEIYPDMVGQIPDTTGQVMLKTVQLIRIPYQLLTHRGSAGNRLGLSPASPPLHREKNTDPGADT